MYVMKKILRVTGKVLLGLLTAIVVALLIIFAIHKCMSANERKMLEDAGYVNLVSAGDYNLNVCTYGNEDGKHTIVAISGMGVNYYSLTIRDVTDQVADENKIVIIDRAGYGLSDDTTEPQTTERVVEDYRTALKNAGCEAPYVLLPHSMGGVYATYWESKYPDEIEAVLFLDSSELSDIGFGLEESGFEDYALAALCKVGLQRIFYDMFDPYAWDAIDEEDMTYAKALVMNNASSYAMCSENDLADDNAKTAYNNIVKNDIPKIYISASAGFKTEDDVKEYYDYINLMLSKHGEEPIVDTSNSETFSKIASSTLEGAEEYREKLVLPYAEKLGNCEVVYIPGDHAIYQQKPDEVANVLKELLDNLA